jgi:hypothetical protein
MKKVKGTSRKKSRYLLYKRAITEGVFILAGILVAFLIDASWDKWQEKDAESQRLEVLRDDLLEAQKAISKYVVYCDGQDSLIKRVLWEVGSARPSYESIDSLLFLIGGFAPYNPNLISYHDATQNGNISKIESIELRHALGTYKSSVELFMGTQVTIQTHFETQVSPLWNQYINVRKTVSTYPRVDMILAYPDVPLPSRHPELIKDLRFSNQLIERGIYFFNLKARRIAVQKDIKSLLTAIEAYL